MKLAALMTTAVLSMTLVAAAPAFAQEQHEQEEKAKPAQEEKKAQPEKPAKQAEKPSAQQEKNVKPEEKNAKPAEKNAKQENNAKPAQNNGQQQQHANNNGAQQQQQHANNNGGGRIPQDRFQANFGREHTFRVTETDYRSHRFQYGGYWFGFADPWPSNWLYTQDVFVVDIDGVYYLCNASYPGVNLALSFNL
jgi:flagellar motor protein MotB